MNAFRYRTLLRIWICLVLSFNVLFSQSKTAPKWINELPMKDGSIFAVGLVNRYFEKKAGEAAADSAARMELAQTIKVNVKSITTSWSGTMQSGLATELEKSIDSEVIASVRNAQILERWIDPEGLTYALTEMPLAGTIGSLQKKIVEQAKKNTDQKDFKKIEKLEVSLKNLGDAKSYLPKDKPQWIQALPEENDAIYALGIAEKFYFYVNGRESAKDKARGELAATMKTEVSAVLTDWYESNEGSASFGLERDVLDEMSKAVSEATLSGSQIVETWYDKTVKWHYALARMSLSQVIGQINEKAQSKVKDSKALKGLNDKLSKLIDRDYLKTKNGFPTWFSKVPKSNGALFAVGIDEGKYYSKSQGLEKARAAARTKLAQTLSVKIESLTSTWMQENSDALDGRPVNDYVSQLTKEATDACLVGSQIVATFTSTSKEGKDGYYALGRLYTGGMVAKLKKKASQIIPLPKNGTQENKGQSLLASGREKAKAALDKMNAALDKLDSN
jgi:hypothetical protein